MSALRAAAEDYLAMRRALGFKLGMQGHLLMQFVGYLEDRGLQWVTAEAALAWATAPDSTTRAWHGIRFGVARRFAAHLRLLDPRCEVPAADALPERHHRLPPHIYTAEQIAALMSEARRLRPQIRAATAETVIGLLAVTGMRSGEAVRLDRGDVDLTAATLTVVSAKGRRSRVLALHPSTVTALTGYLRLRDDTFPAASTPAFFVSSAGRRLGHSTLNTTFRLLVQAAGLEPPPESRARRPRPHDMRHTAAVTSLVAWYKAGDDVQARLPALSAYLGHAELKDTYWYISAVPELLSLASDRADSWKEHRS